MGHLEKLKIVAQQQKRGSNKAEHRRVKLLEKLDEQLDMVQALIDGEVYAKTQVRYVKNAEGQRVPVERTKRVRAWYWMSGAGTCYFQVWYGSKVIELRPGLTAISSAKREELPAVIRAVIDAVQAGELDAQIEAVAERNKEQLQKTATPKLVKKAS